MKEPVQLTFEDLIEYVKSPLFSQRVSAWKERLNITQYLQSSAEYRNINVLSPEYEIQNFWVCTPNGLKIGCMSISHDEVIKIAKYLKLMP